MSDLKLSEAIRLGAMLTPQGFGNDALSGEARCALGAAAAAAGMQCIFTLHLLVERWPFLHTEVAYPTSTHRRIRLETTRAGDLLLLRSAIWRLNDVSGWTREQIADWVETIEAQQAQPVADLVAVAQ